MNATLNTPEILHLPAQGALRPIRFYCAAPRASNVELSGDFNRWHPQAMRRLVDGWWFAEVEMHHGHHQYRFLVDGKSVLDPRATGVARDERNEPVSLIAVS